MYILLFTVLLGLPQVYAATHGKYAYPPQRFSARGLKDIKVIGVRGSLKMTGHAHGKAITLRVQQSTGKRLEDWHLSVDRRGQTLYLEVFNVAYGKEWRNQVREDQWPEFDIQLDGPALPMSVGWREGALEFNNWNANLELSLLKGGMKIHGGRGDLNVQSVRADVEVFERRGRVAIQGETGRVNLVDLRGNLKLSWLSGELALNDCQGQLWVESRDSNLTVRRGGGELKAGLQKGHARIRGFQGTVYGEGEDSRWDVAASAPADVNVTTRSGPVGVEWQGGAKVFLTSIAGLIQAPTFLASSERDGRQVRTGVKLGKSRGQVFIKTASGGIQWR